MTRNVTHVIPSDRLCKKAGGVLRQSSARTVNERYFRYLAVRSFDGSGQTLRFSKGERLVFTQSGESGSFTMSGDVNTPFVVRLGSPRTEERHGATKRLAVRQGIG